MFLTLVIRNGLPDEMISIGPKRDAEEQHFLKTCRSHVPDFGDYTEDDLSAILDNGYCEFNVGPISSAVCFLDLTNTEGYEAASRCPPDNPITPDSPNWPNIY